MNINNLHINGKSSMTISMVVSHGRNCSFTPIEIKIRSKQRSLGEMFLQCGCGVKKSIFAIGSTYRSRSPIQGSYNEKNDDVHIQSRSVNGKVEITKVVNHKCSSNPIEITMRSTVSKKSCTSGREMFLQCGCGANIYTYGSPRTCRSRSPTHGSSNNINDDADIRSRRSSQGRYPRRYGPKRFSPGDDGEERFSGGQDRNSPDSERSSGDKMPPKPGRVGEVQLGNIIFEDGPSFDEEVTDSDEEVTDSDEEVTDSEEEVTDNDEDVSDSDEELTDDDEEVSDSDEELTDGDEGVSDSDEEMTDIDEEF